MTDLLPAAVAAIEDTVALLRDSSCDAWADELACLAADIRSSDRFAQKEALFRVGQICQPKALGDVAITGMTWRAWSSHLEHVHDACARALNVLERAPT